jgi:hypothetical protein
MPKEIDMIQVRQTAEQDPFIFEVVVREGKGETRHQVTMSRETCERLTSGKHTPERCLEAAFQFLLEREPKDPAIRRHSDLAVFPRVRAGDSTLPFAVLTALQRQWGVGTAAKLIGVNIYEEGTAAPVNRSVWLDRVNRDDTRPFMSAGPAKSDRAPAVIAARVRT